MTTQEIRIQEAEDREPSVEWSKAIQEQDIPALMSHYAPFEVSQSVISKHLKILEQAGLIQNR